MDDRPTSQLPRMHSRATAALLRTAAGDRPAAEGEAGRGLSPLSARRTSDWISVSAVGRPIRRSVRNASSSSATVAPSISRIGYLSSRISSWCGGGEVARRDVDPDPAAAEPRDRPRDVDRVRRRSVLALGLSEHDERARIRTRPRARASRRSRNRGRPRRASCRDGDDATGRQPRSVIHAATGSNISLPAECLCSSWSSRAAGFPCGS